MRAPRSIVALTLLLAAISPFIASGHVTGRSVERDAGAYLIDVGLSDPIVAGEPAYLDFKLWKKTPAGAAEYSDVWLRIVSASSTLFATGIHHAEIGNTGLLYTFETPGTYTVYARYEAAAETRAETTFEVTVLEKQGSGVLYKWLPYIAAALIGAAFALGLSYTYRRRKGSRMVS